MENKNIIKSKGCIIVFVCFSILKAYGFSIEEANATLSFYEIKDL